MSNINNMFYILRNLIRAKLSNYYAYVVGGNIGGSIT